MRPIRSRIKLTVATGIVLSIVCGTIAYATVTATILAIGTNADAPLVEGPATVTFRHLATSPDDTGTWHYHPGYVYNVVKSGSVIIEDGCGEVASYSEGQAFETSEGRVHRAINEGDVDAVEYNVFIREEGKPLTRQISGNVRRCGPVSKVAECMNDGWMKFDFPHSFENQGACIAFVNHRPRVTLLSPLDPLAPPQ